MYMYIYMYNVPPPTFSTIEYLMSLYSQRSYVGIGSPFVSLVEILGDDHDTVGSVIKEQKVGIHS